MAQESLKPKKQERYTDSSGKEISENRASQLAWEDDTFQDPNVGLYDIDEAIYYYFEHVIQPRVKDGVNEIRVPIVYGSPERWASVQKSGVFRDPKSARGKKRNTISRDPGTHLSAEREIW